jgi:hypothetical protein
LGVDQKLTAYKVESFLHANKAQSTIVSGRLRIKADT